MKNRKTLEVSQTLHKKFLGYADKRGMKVKAATECALNYWMGHGPGTPTEDPSYVKHDLDKDIRRDVIRTEIKNLTDTEATIDVSDVLDQI